MASAAGQVVAGRHARVTKPRPSFRPHNNNHVPHRPLPTRELLTEPAVREEYKHARTLKRLYRSYPTLRNRVRLRATNTRESRKHKDETNQSRRGLTRQRAQRPGGGRRFVTKGGPAANVPEVERKRQGRKVDMRRERENSQMHTAASFFSGRRQPHISARESARHAERNARSAFKVGV